MVLCFCEFLITKKYRSIDFYSFAKFILDFLFRTTQPEEMNTLNLHDIISNKPLSSQPLKIANSELHLFSIFV